MSGETSAPEEAQKEAKLQENVRVQDEVLVYREGIKDGASAEAKRKGDEARIWLTEKKIHSGWLPAIDYMENEFWSKRYLPAGRNELKEFLLAVDFKKPPSENSEAIQKLTPKGAAKVEAPEKSPERRSHTDAEKQAIVNGIVEVGSTKKFGRAGQWRSVKGVQERLRDLGVQEDWLSTEPEETTPETFMDVYRGAPPEGQKSFREKVDFTKPPDDQTNKEALRPLIEAGRQQKGGPTEARDIKAPETPKPQETAQKVTFEQLVAKARSEQKDQYVERIHKMSGEIRQPKTEHRRDTQEAIMQTAEVMEGLRKTANYFDKFFPGMIKTIASVYVKAEQANQLACDLETIYGRKVGQGDLNELSTRMAECVTEVVFQRWAGTEKKANGIDYPHNAKLVEYDTSKVQHQINERAVFDWLGKEDPATTRIHQKYQFWVERIEYGADKTTVGIVEEKGLVRAEAGIKPLTDADKNEQKHILAVTEEKLETFDEARKACYLFQTAKAEGVGILLHLEPEFGGLAETCTNRYLSHLPEKFTPSEELSRALEDLKKSPKDEASKAWVRRELLAEWIALSVFNPKYMKEYFPEEQKLCLDILSQPFPPNQRLRYASKFMVG